MKALTIWQPWATMIALGWKPIENRGWCPTERQLADGERFAIHAATRPMDAHTWDAALLVAANAGFHLDDAEEAQFLRRCRRESGSVVATARFGLPMSSCLDEGQYPDFHRLWWDRHSYGWLLNNVQAVAPVAVRGRQGLWNLPGDTVLKAAA